MAIETPKDCQCEVFTTVLLSSFGETTGILPEDDLYCEIPASDVNEESQLGGPEAVGGPAPASHSTLESLPRILAQPVQQAVSLGLCQHLCSDAQKDME